MGSWVLAHPCLSLFGVVIVNRLGVPIPADPFLLAAGALAGAGKVNLLQSILSALVAAFVADLAWFEAGRHKGGAILRVLCRVSLEPASCVRRTEDVFGRHGVAALLVSKFIPGLSTVAAPMAGIIGMGHARFSAISILSTLSWILALEATGFFLSGRLAEALHLLSRLAGGLATLAVLLFALYLSKKILQRRRFIRSLRVARITPAELSERMATRNDVVVVDLRHSSELAHSPEVIPGALRMSPEELDARHGEIPRGKEVVLVCT